MKNKTLKLDNILKISLILGTLTVSLAIACYFVIILPSKDKTKIDQTEKILDEREIKVEALRAFHNQVNKAHVEHDWSLLYDLVPDSLREILTREEFVELNRKTEKPEYFSVNTVIKDIKIDGDKGFVNRIKTSCVTEECEGDNKLVDDASIEYEYIKEKWGFPQPIPSERALSVASKAYIEIISKSEDSKKVFYKKYSFGKENTNFALRTYALELDKNLEQLVLVESLIEKSKENNNKSSTGGTYSEINPFSIQTESPSANKVKDILDEVERKGKEKCQSDLNEYNSCRSDYNTKLAEYNTCLVEKSDSSSWHYNSFCSKPFDFCRKPICAY